MQWSSKKNHEGKNKYRLRLETRGIKGTVNVFLSDPVLVEWHVRFTTLSLKALSSQVWIRYHVFVFKTGYFQLGGLSINDLCISCTLEKIEKLSEFKTSQARKTKLSSSLLIRLNWVPLYIDHIPHVNGGLLEITMTAHFVREYNFWTELK